MNSTQIQSGVCKFARGRGWRAHKNVRPSRRGAFDFSFTKWKRQIVFMEFKAPGEDLDPLQELELKRLRAEGHEAYVITSVEEGKAIFAHR